MRAQWYNEIEAGVKKIEYRELKPFWVKRLCETFEGDEWGNCDPSEIRFTPRHYDTLTFVYGYTKKQMVYKCEGIELIEDEGWLVFAIHIGERIS